VTLIKLDGLTLFGPGSEWFWSMLQFLLVGITLLGIYRQLQAQRSATEVALRTRLIEVFTDPRSAYMDLRAAIYVLQGGTGFHAAVSDVANWMENVADLLQRGLVSRDWVWYAFSTPIQAWWAALTPTVMERRKVEGHLLWVGFEELAAEMATIDRQRPVYGSQPGWNPTMARGHDCRIDSAVGNGEGTGGTCDSSVAAPH
jgi:hypothetical protein